MWKEGASIVLLGLDARTKPLSIAVVQEERDLNICFVDIGVEDDQTFGRRVLVGIVLCRWCVAGCSLVEESSGRKRRLLTLIPECSPDRHSERFGDEREAWNEK